MTRVALQPCFVLHGRPYRETSQILELLSRDHGRLGVVARGARRPGRGRGALQPFQPLLVSWSGRGELPTVTGVEGDGPPFLFRGALIAGALYLNELTLRLLHRGDPHPEIYHAYGQALGRLQTAPEAEAVFRVFEKRLLESLGYAPLLTHEGGSGEAVAAERRYRYRPEHGPVAAGEGDPGQASGEPLIHGRTLLALAAEHLEDPRDLAEAKRLMRFVINLHLGDRPLETRALFRATR